MSGFDQNYAVISLEQALVPGSSLIDGRTELDQLSFLANFASLINFYDHNNTINGNWTPFLLKDPIILLASISKTRFEKMHSLYLQTCLKLEQILVLEANTNDIPFSFNQLFDQLTRIFMHIKHWIYFMHRSDDDYNLKHFVIHQVKAKFSKYFWAILSLRQNLFLSSAIKGIEPIDRSKLYFFEPYDELIWKQNKDKSPYWEVLNLKQIIKKNSANDFFKALKNVGDELFSFFHTVIQHATPELEKLKSRKSKYPDTILLRTFVDLLKAHQAQLNGISQKHLEFYYKDILKQTENPAVPDCVFLCADLSNKDAAFTLPVGTLFDAGLDAQKKSIEFRSLENVSLNPAAIAGAYTLRKISDTTGFYTLSLQNVPNPGVLQLDEDGKTKSWETCGSAKSTGATLTKTGISFASPMLLLREGQRAITLTLNFVDKIELKLLQQAQYYLSTQKAWLEITSLVKVQADYLTVATQVTLLINLDATQPAIESFLKNPNGLDPDGLNSLWPLFKIEFTKFSVHANPPVISKLKIAVNVSNVKTFQLYNDYGALSTKAPFQLFGPIPLVNSNFIIGNSEIFSKPIDDLNIELDWDNLPLDFLAYYQAYNDFLSPKKSKNVEKSIWNLIFGWIKKIFHIKSKPPTPPDVPV